MWTGWLMAAALVANGVEETTHKQTATIEVRADDGAKAALHSYCLAAGGEILAGVGGKELIRTITDEGFSMEEVDSPTEVRVYDPDTSELIETWPLDIKPEAMCTGPDGKVYVAGEGWIVVYDETGEEMRRARAPHAKLLFENEDALRAAAKEELESNRAMFEQQIADFEKQLEQFEGRDDLDANEKMMKEQTEMILESYAQMTAQWNIPVEEHMEVMRQSKLKFSSISVGEDVVYAAVPGLKGYGFEVWKMNTDLEDGSKVVADLSGCCGQMEARAHGDELLVAENGRHRVVQFDADGVLTHMWGERSERGEGAGFGSCCNPMNLAFDPSGDVFAAEAEGVIKRYTSDGVYQGTVAHCDLPPGCKNVAIRLDYQRDRVYMIDIVRGNIIVFAKKVDTAPAGRSQEF